MCMKQYCSTCKYIFFLCAHSENMYLTVCQSNFYVLSVTRHSFVNLIGTLEKKHSIIPFKNHFFVTEDLPYLCMSVLMGKQLNLHIQDAHPDICPV